MSMTLTDRLTRGTYLSTTATDRPGVICLSYSWMSDALKMLPLPRRASGSGWCSTSLKKIYPGLDIGSTSSATRSPSHGRPIPTSSAPSRAPFPATTATTTGMYCHFMQDDLPPHERGIFLAGDDVSWTPGWVEGAVTTGLNAVWGILTHLGGASRRQSRPGRPLRGAGAGGPARLSGGNRARPEAGLGKR